MLPLTAIRGQANNLAIGQFVIGVAVQHSLYVITAGRHFRQACQRKAHRSFVNEHTCTRLPVLDIAAENQLRAGGVVHQKARLLFIMRRQQ